MSLTSAEDEAKASLGTLKGKLAITFVGGRATITERGIALLSKKTPEERFLSKTFPLEPSSIKDEDNLAFDLLRRRRRILLVERVSTVTARLTDEGKRLMGEDLSSRLLDQVTPELILSGEWKGKRFRRYDFSLAPPRFHGSRAHPLSVVIEEMRHIWLAMGFTEITGPGGETAFWCMDSM